MDFSLIYIYEYKIININIYKKIIIFSIRGIIKAER